MIKDILGFRTQYGGPVRDLTPGLSDLPDRIWPKATPENVRGILDCIIVRIPKEVDIPEDITLRQLAGRAIRPTFEGLPEETRNLVKNILQDKF